MKFHELNTSSKKNRKRKGRGIAAGQGKTAGRGTKGQGARSGGLNGRLTFEGGQTPLSQRIPKLRGFNSFSEKPTTVTTDLIAAIGKKKVTEQDLVDAKIIENTKERYKVVAAKELKTGFEFAATAASKGAIDQVKAAGGSLSIAKPTTK